MTRRYPADPAEAGARLFRAWFGSHYARATSRAAWDSDEHVGTARFDVARRWSLHLTVLNTLAADASMEWEAGRAAIESRLDTEGRSFALWVPRGAVPPSSEPGLSRLVLAVDSADSLEDGRKELRFPVDIHLRRVATQGSVVTASGGLAPHWAQFTNRVPGTFQLNSLALHRLPSEPAERELLFEHVVLAAGQPDVDDGLTITTIDAWSANDLEEGGSCVVGTPRPDNDEWSSSIRRNLRKLLLRAAGVRDRSADATALVVLGPSTYAEEERLTWTLRGMDPSLYAGFDILLVCADGVMKPLLLPGPGVLPWDA